MDLVVGSEPGDHDDVVVLDELARAAIDRGRTRGRIQRQARHRPQGHRSMKGFPRERLHVHLLQVSAEDLVQRLDALVRRIIRRREPDDVAIAVADSCDATRGAHGNPSSMCTIYRAGRPDEPYAALSPDRSRRSKVLRASYARMDAAMFPGEQRRSRTTSMLRASRLDGRAHDEDTMSTRRSWPLQSYPIVASVQEPAPCDCLEIAPGAAVRARV